MNRPSPPHASSRGPGPLRSGGGRFAHPPACCQESKPPMLLTPTTPGKRGMRPPPWLLPLAVLALVMPAVLGQQPAPGPGPAGDAAAAAPAPAPGPGAAPAPADVGEPIEATVKTSVWELFQAGGFFMYPLLLC